MNIKTIKLKNSEEVLCEVLDNKENTETITIKNPCVLVPSGQNGIAMAPWLPFADIEKTGVDIPRDTIMFIADVVEEIQSQYEQQFSAVVTPKQKIITPSGPLGLAK